MSLGTSRSGTPLYSSPCLLGNNSTQSPLTIGPHQNMFVPIILPTNQNYPSITPNGNEHVSLPVINNNSNNQYRQQQLVKYENLSMSLL